MTGVELILAHQETGEIWEISSMATSVSWATERTGTPGSLKLTLIQAGQIKISEGDVVRFSVDGQLQFYGWVFTRSMDRWGVMDLTCYDRLRYLKANASYAFYGQTAGNIISQIAGDLQVTTGAITDTGYQIPSLIEEDQSCLDIIGEAVQQTLLGTGKIFIFYDDGNGLALQEAAEMTSNVVIGDKSLLTEYTYKSDIDSQTYNSVKLARPNEETGMADVFIAQDSATIAQWGLLQLYQTVDGDVNDAQMQARAEASLSYYNQPLRTLSGTSLGVPGLRAGQLLLLRISDLDGAPLERYLMIEKITHKWEQGTHTMDFDLMGI